MPLSCENIHGTIGEYQRNYLYKFEMDLQNVDFNNLTNGFGANISQDFTTYLKDGTASNSLSGSTFNANIDLYNKNAVFANRSTKEETINWCGEFFYVPTTDSSKRDETFEFFDDESNRVYDLFNALKDLTGNEKNQAGVWGIQSKFDVRVQMVSVDKSTITRSRKLIGCRVYSVEYDEAKKDQSGLNSVKVGIKWDRNKELFDERGKTI